MEERLLRLLLACWTLMVQLIMVLVEDLSHHFTLHLASLITITIRLVEVVAPSCHRPVAAMGWQLLGNKKGPLPLLWEGEGEEEEELHLNLNSIRHPMVTPVKVNKGVQVVHLHRDNLEE